MLSKQSLSPFKNPSSLIWVLAWSAAPPPLQSKFRRRPDCTSHSGQEDPANSITCPESSNAPTGDPQLPVKAPQTALPTWRAGHHHSELALQMFSSLTKSSPRAEYILCTLSSLLDVRMNLQLKRTQYFCKHCWVRAPKKAAAAGGSP